MTARDRTRILLVDDHHLFAEAMEVILSSDPRLEVVGRASDGARAVELALELRPDVVLMDVHMPKLDGVEATRRIVARRAAQVVMLSSSDDPAEVRRARAAGAAAYLVKGCALADVVDTILHAKTRALQPAAEHHPAFAALSCGARPAKAG